MTVEFTQYLRPNGQRRYIEIDVPEDTEQKAKALVSCGCLFSAEILVMDIVSFTCEQDGYDADGCVAIELSRNDASATGKVINLINTSYDKLRECGDIKDELA